MSDMNLTVVETDKMQNYLVVKDNQLIKKSFYEYNVMEQRLIACAISTLDSTKGIDVNDDKLVRGEFGLDVFCELCGLERRSVISYLMKCLENLKSKCGWCKNPDGSIELMSWISDAKIEPENNKVIVWFSLSVKPYLLNLEADFTEYKLPMVLRFKCKYSNMIFDLIYAEYRKNSFVVGDTRKMSSGNLQMSVDDMRVRLRTKKKNGATTHNDMTFKDIRVFVLEPVIKDINEFTDIMVDVEYLKRGRKVETIVFQYRPKTKDELENVPLFRGKKFEDFVIC